MSSVDVDDRQVKIDEDSCLALASGAEQCGYGTDTDASDPEAGLCGVHAGSDVARVTDFDNPAWVGLRDDFVEIFRSETEAYALATISPDVEDVWHALTGLQDLAIGPVELTASQACGRARNLADHPDLDVDDHPLAVGGCIALQGRSAKNHSCPNSGYGTTLLCGTHKDADLRGTVLDDNEPGPDLDTVTVDGAEYLLVEQRGADLIVVDPDGWELRRLDGAAGAETRWSDEETTPDLPDRPDTLVLVGCGDAKADERRPAKDLYTSNYFGLKRRYAEEHGDEWAILSAKYGLLDPEAEIDPYDISLDDVNVGEWELDVLADLPDVRDTEVVLLAGPDYADVLEGDLFMYGADVELPTQGMKIGERMSWLSEQLDEDVQEGVDDGRPVVPPQAPMNLPKYLREGVEKQSPDRLRRLAEYAEKMADYKEAKAERKLQDAAEQDVDDVPDEWDDDAWEDALDDARDEGEIPSGKGTLTTKTIDGRGYYYLQWREGDKIRSQYVAPVVPAGDS